MFTLLKNRDTLTPPKKNLWKLSNLVKVPTQSLKLKYRIILGLVMILENVYTIFTV